MAKNGIRRSNILRVAICCHVPESIKIFYYINLRIFLFYKGFYKGLKIQHEAYCDSYTLEFLMILFTLE